MTSRNLTKVKNVITKHHGVVVVSASGKRFDGDTKVTDLLIRWHNSSFDEQIFKQIAERYRHMVYAHAIPIDIDSVLNDALNRAKHFNSYAYSLSIGEEISARIMSAYLGAQYVEASQVICFGKAKCLIRQTLNNIKRTMIAGKLYVMGGFYGGSADGGRQIFSRGGGDITGALVAKALSSTLYENWTDVNGVCVANPRIVPYAKNIPCVSYNDMYLLASNGAEVLHPDSIKPLEQCAIPIHIRNIYNDSQQGTMVQNSSSSSAVIGITDKFVDNVWRTVIVCRDNMQQILSSVLHCLQSNQITPISVYAQHNYCVFECKQRILTKVYSALLLTHLIN